MMVSDEEKRWLVVGIAMNKVAAPVFRDYIKTGMDTHYANLDIYCRGLVTPCTLKTLTYHHVNTNPSFKHLKFQNVNNNVHLHGKHKNLYNYNINTSVDLAKLFLPDYLAMFSAFDESLDMSAILRLLGFNNPAPIFHSLNPLISIQTSADDVRENVRNKWGHCNVTDWTEVLFNDCFSKLETLVRSLGLTGGMEKSTLDQLSDWKTKGCQLCMGHAVDQQLLSLVQQDVKELEKKIKKTEAEQSAIQEALTQQRTEQTKLQNTVGLLQDQQSSTTVQLEEHDEQLEAVLEWKAQQMKENAKIYEKLVSVEKTLSEKLLIRVQGVEDDLSGVKAHISQTDGRVKQLEENGVRKKDDLTARVEAHKSQTDERVQQLEENGIRVKDDFREVKAHISQTDERVKQLEENVRHQRMKDGRPEASPVDTFDVKGCQRKFAEHYQRTAKVPTTVWSSNFQVDLDQIYTRLSWVREEQTLAGSSQKELNHYTELFTEKTKSGAVPKRILVQGETGIGKTTFVKKLLLDWSNLNEAKMEEAEEREVPHKKFNDDECKDVEDVIEDNDEWSTDNEDMDEGGAKMDEEQKDVLRKFELVLSINLKDVSKCQTLGEVISHSRLLPRDEESSIDDLLCHIRKHQEKVLFVFDGYDEYRTGSKAEEKYGSRSSSPIYEIFHLNILRDCTVLVTTRPSRADEIQRPADIQAEITGFNMSDREEFMRKLLGNQTQVDDLLCFLEKSKMEDLARVPLLALFFCLLWKEKKEKLMELVGSKTKLFRAITKHILQHSHRKHSPSHVSKLKEADYEEILAEIGQVAVGGLLKGDLMFEFGQLPEKVRCEESMIVGLLQLSEYGPSLEPMEMVSFIHKSIQEYLAAWYITYRCVPEGNLGGIEQHVRTLEDCEAFENVFQFICGLSDDGAVKVFQHLTSVRISDPTLDLSKTVPDFENETDVPLCDVTVRHERFIDMVYNSFREVRSKTELLTHCFDCTCGIVLVTEDRPFFKLMPQVNILTELAHYFVFLFHGISIGDEGNGSVMYKSLEFLNCLHVPLTLTESSNVLTIGDLVRKFQTTELDCCFRSILCFLDGQFQFYITELFLQCDDHPRLFMESTTDSVLSGAARMCSEQSCLKFLSSLHCFNLSGQTVKALGLVIRNCKLLNSIGLHKGDDSVCDLLEQVPNPSKCSLTIGGFTFPHGVSGHLTSAGAVQLASLLPQFDNVITLVLDLSVCCSVAVDSLATSITHKTLETLVLRGIGLTPAAALALGRLLPEASSLEALELTVVGEGIVQSEEIEALFGGCNKTLPLKKLTLSGFSVRGCLAPLTKSFRFFPNLIELNLGGFNGEFNMDEQNLCLLLESLRFIPNLRILSVKGKSLSQAHCCTAEVNPVAKVTHKTLQFLSLGGITLTPAVAAALGRLLPEMPSLLSLKLTGVDGSGFDLEAKEMEALFGGFNKTLPLYKLSFSGFSVRGCLTPLSKSLRFFPNLSKLKLENLNMNEHDQCSLLESFGFIAKNVMELSIHCKPLGYSDCPTAELTTIGARSYIQYSSSMGEKLELNQAIGLTPAVAEELGRLIPEMASLNSFELTGVDGSILQAKEIIALFGGFNKTLPLQRLTVGGFSVRGCLAPLTKSFRFFPNLRDLNLGWFNAEFSMDEQNLCLLLESLRFIPNLETLSVKGKSLSEAHCCTAEVNPVVRVTLNTLEQLHLDGIRLTPAVAVVLGRLLPGMVSLKVLELTGVDGSVLEAKEIRALFGGFNKTLPLSMLTFSGFSTRGCLASLTKILHFFPNLRELNLGELNMDENDLCGLLNAVCSTVEGSTMANMTRKSLEKLNLIGISLTPAVAAALCRLLPEMPSLEILELTGVDGSILEAKEMEALFGGFNKTLPLRELTFRGFSVRGSLAPLTNSFRFFPNLRELNLGGFNREFNMDEQNLCLLLESLRFIPNLTKMSLKGKLESQAHCCTAEIRPIASVSHKTLEQLHLDGLSLTPAVAVVLGRSLPEMSSLQELKLTGVGGSILEAKEMEALFGGFNKTLPLSELTFCGFSVRGGCLAPLTKSFCFFPNLRELNFNEELIMNEQNLCLLLESLRFIPKLKKMGLKGKLESQAHCCTADVNQVASVTRKTLEHLRLDGISLTPAAAAVLGELLPEMSSLQELKLTGVDGSILEANEMEALFGRFNKTLSFSKLTFSSFSVRGSLAPLNKSFRFFPKLRELNLEKLDMDEHDLAGLLESFQFIPGLCKLNLSGNPLGHAVRSIVPHVSNLQELKYLWIDQTGHSEEDLNYVRDTLQQTLPELKIQKWHS
ncbi:hypothetical protein ACROYT_G017067 [Oculina patagonica]